MVEYRYRVVHEDKSAGNTATDITNAIDMSTNEGIEARVDKFTLSMTAKELPVTLGIQDGIKIYFGKGNALPNSLVMDGIITDLTFQMTESGKVWSVRGDNKLEALLNNLRPSSYTSKTSSYIIGNLIDQVNNQNSAGVEAGWWTNIGKDIASTTKTFDYYQPYKPIFQQIEELSQTEYTGTNTHIYYLDTNNVFHWLPRPTESSGTLVEGVNMIDVKAQKATWDVVNAIIIHAGDDKNDSPVFALAYNAISIGKLGYKWKFVAMTEVAKEIISNNPGYTNDQVRAAARTEAKRRGKAVVEKLGAPRWKVDITVPGSTSYNKGQLYDLQIDSIGWNSINKKTMRLTELKQKFTAKAGWTTVLHFEEDEEVAISELI